MAVLPIINTFTEQDVAKWFGAREVVKARPYVESIQKLEVDKARIAGWVQGTARAPYRVRIDFFEKASQNMMPIVSSCTCPVGFRCKHSAATRS